MNPKTKKIMIIVAVILVIGGVGFYFWKRKKGESGSGDPFKALVDVNSNSDSTTTQPSKEQLLAELQNDNSFPLKMGSRGKRVEQLQRWLIADKGATLPSYGVDGIWGTETEAVVREKLGKDNVSKDYFEKTEMYLQPSNLF